jgi:hypothetical protein
MIPLLSRILRRRNEQPVDPIAEASRRLDAHRAANIAKLDEPYRKAGRKGAETRRLRFMGEGRS